MVPSGLPTHRMPQSPVKKGGTIGLDFEALPDVAQSMILCMCLDCKEVALDGGCLGDVMRAAEAFRVNPRKLLHMNGECMWLNREWDKDSEGGFMMLCTGAMWANACVLAVLRMYPNDITVSGSFALSRAPGGPYPYNGEGDVDIFEMGSKYRFIKGPDGDVIDAVEKTFAERYTWLIKLGELIGVEDGSWQGSSVEDIKEGHDYTYRDKDGDFMVNGTFDAQFTVRGTGYQSRIQVIQVSKPALTTPQSITEDFDMRMLCVYVDPTTWQAVESVPGALDDIRHRRLVLQQRGLDRIKLLGEDAPIERDYRVHKYMKRGFIPDIQWGGKNDGDGQ